MGTVPWSRENYERSLTSRGWSCTPLDGDWSACEGCVELRAIFDEEMALPRVPDWAREILDRMIGNLPMCGHYTFPQPVLAICAAIRAQKCPDMILGHYAADPGRKRLMQRYVYCLDAWLQQAPLEAAIGEMAMRRDDGRDWPGILTCVYDALGPRSERKALLVRRVIHRQRWWIKTLIWPGDTRGRFMLDVYAGDVRGDEAEHGAYGNPPFGDPYFAELRLPEVQDLSARIREMGDGDLPANIEHSHLCAPKAFRYLEKTILAIGGVDGGENGDAPVLQCENMVPDFAAYSRWYTEFLSHFEEWLDGDETALPGLGDITPVSHWLARILHHKLRLYEQCNPFGRLVGAQPGGKPGTRTI